MSKKKQTPQHLSDDEIREALDNGTAVSCGRFGYGENPANPDPFASEYEQDDIEIFRVGDAYVDVTIANVGMEGWQGGRYASEAEAWAQLPVLYGDYFDRAVGESGLHWLGVRAAIIAECENQPGDDNDGEDDEQWRTFTTEDGVEVDAGFRSVWMDLAERELDWLVSNWVALEGMAEDGEEDPQGRMDQALDDARLAVSAGLSPDEVDVVSVTDGMRRAWETMAALLPRG